jgi:hypothetical protein
VPATWMVGGVGDGVSMDGGTDEGRVEGSSSSRWSRALAATLSRGKKEGGGRDLRAPRAAVRDRRTILTGQSLGKDAISPPARTFGESTRVRTPSRRRLSAPPKGRHSFARVVVRDWETHHSRLDAPALRLAGVCAFMFGSSARSLRQVLPPENIMSYRVSIGLLRRRLLLRPDAFCQ